MAAYAALVSLSFIIEQIQHHSRPPISFNKTQVESLTRNITFLQEFLEGYSLHIVHSNEADPLESRIADAAYAAEDIIESHIVGQILAGSTTDQNISSIEFYQTLEKVIEEMDLIKKEVMEIEENIGVQDQPQRDSSSSATSLGSASTGQKNTMVGFDDVFLEILDKLTGGQSDRQVIPIVGMGGIGKTTLAKNIYASPLIAEHFDICAWVTISQEYNTQKILREVGRQINIRGMGNLSENELGEILYKHLWGRRYLLVMDDLWSIEVWDKIKFFFPDYNNGSRIVVTTRLSNLAFQLTNSYSLEMKLLHDDKSWDLFCKVVFGEEGCPIEFEKIGKKIAKNCKGLPLSIIVVGGLLAKSKRTQEYWEYIGGNLNSIVNSDDNERCLKVLHMSYNQLPVYLKPCFLYVGVFSEDSEICVSVLVKLWVAEGFLKPISGKSLEEIAKEFLKELIDRNLFMVHSLGSTGNIKFCNIHDLVRDLCLKEAQKERFYNVTRQHIHNIPQGINTKRRIVVCEKSEENVFDIMQSTSIVRSLICESRSLIFDFGGVLPSVNLRLLRILKTFDKYSHWSGEYFLEDMNPGDRYFLEGMFQLVNLRYLTVKVHPDFKFPSSIYLLWNLQTLIVDTGYSKSLSALTEFWNVPQLRHVKFKEGVYLPDPPQDDIVLGNLQTLEKIINFKCDEEMVKRIPNIKKLGILFDQVEGTSSCNYYVGNLSLLHALESFLFQIPLGTTPSGTDIWRNLAFPHSLKKLTLQDGSGQLHWQDLLQNIGSLPLLEKLKLYRGRFKEREWETVEGQFRSLKFLMIEFCTLQYWSTQSSHFPCLEHLRLRKLRWLKEIPAEIGEIPTLQSIHVLLCSDSAVISAKNIVDEQEELAGEVAFEVLVDLDEEDEELESLAGPNFRVISK